MARGVVLLSGGLFSSALALAGCGSGGGGGGGGGGVIVAPTPSPPTSTPTPPAPTPSPSPTYPTFAELTGNLTFPSACTSFNQGVPAIANPATRFGEGLTFEYASGTQIHTITGDGLMLTFGPGDIDPASPAGVTFYAKPVAGGTTQRLRPQRPGAGGSPMVYTRVMGIITSVPGVPVRSYTCVIGVPTLVTDVPAVSTVAYSKIGFGATASRSVVGGATTTLTLSKSEVTVSVNLTTGEVTAVLHLIGTPLPMGSGADIDLGTVTGVADIDPATGGYYGTDWTSSDSTVLFAQFGGRFFGPQGIETGYALTLVTERADARVTISGAVFGIR